MNYANQITGMPKMRAAFAGWQSIITLSRVTQSVVDDGLVQEVTEEIKFRGTVQPFSPKELMLKPEGQRAWQWLMIHCLAGELNLDTNDRIVYNGQIFKIMAQNDYSLNNYIEYHACKDYQDE